MTKPSAPKTLPVNWEVTVICVDCKTQFTVANADPSVDLVNEGRSRMIMITVPNECPECRNLRLVKGGAG